MACAQGRAGAVTAMGSGAPGSASEVYDGVQNGSIAADAMYAAMYAAMPTSAALASGGT